MIGFHPFSRVILPVFLLLTIGAMNSPGASLNQQQTCGKEIYSQGIDCRGREIRAVLGDMEIPAKVQSCSSCHGSDGRGRPEGGLDPGDITWEHLSISYGHAHDTGRTHPAFTEKSWYRAVTLGIDPAGHKLSTLMPRFKMSHEQLADLFAYIKRLSSDFDPGIEPSSVTIGSLVPEKGNSADAGNAVRAVLAAYFEQVNQHGGIYGRRIILQFGDVGAGRPEAMNNAQRLIHTPVFATIAPFVSGMENDFARVVLENRVPSVGPLTVSVPDDPGNGGVFYLSPGLRQLARELVRWAVEQRHINSLRAAVIFASRKAREEVSSALESAWQSFGSAPQELEYSPSNREQLVRSLQQQKTASIFFVGSGTDALELMQTSHQAGWTPQVFLLGPLLDNDVLDAPAEFQGNILVAYPARQADGLGEFDAFSMRHHLPATDRWLQASAYCAAKVFEDALARAGRELSRERFLRSLEQMRNFQPGPLPEITFGPNRRVGSTKVEILCADLKNRRFVSACAEEYR